MVNTSAVKRHRICCFLFWGRAVFGVEHKERGCNRVEEIVGGVEGLGGMRRVEEL